MIAIAETPHDLAIRLCQEFLLHAHAAQSRGKLWRVALSGGESPQGLYQCLGEQVHETPWSALDIYLSDERAVPIDHPDSNFGMIWRLWLSKAPRSARITRIQGEQGAQNAAQAYRQALDRTATPFDLILLGLGLEGHTASLFPDTPAHTESVIAIPATEHRTARISLGMKTLIQARARWVIVTGAAKAPRLAQCLTGTYHTPMDQLLKQAPVDWWLDQKAAIGIVPTLTRTFV